MADIDTSSVAGIENEQFDFVIVGGGTSGLVMASRLTENPNIRVLVLEAGANRLRDPKVTIPGLAASTYFDPDYDWCITSEPQEHLNGRLIGQPTGKLLGGSSAINLGMVIYPSKSGFDSWEKLGNPGWGWDQMAPYFRKFHTFTEPKRKDLKEELSLSYMTKDAQGGTGPVQVSFGSEEGFPPFNQAWPHAFKNLKLDITGDPISGVSTGPFNNPATIDPATRTRSHAGSAYYSEGVAKRANLRVVTEALVEKILLAKSPDDGTIRATGVQFTPKDGQRRQIPAGREVILAAGALKTPQLLELSGIGDKRLLAAHGVACLVDNPSVGENLQDHGFVPCSWEVADPLTSGDLMRDPSVAAAALAAYTQSSPPAGPLAINPLSSAFLPLLNDDEHLTPAPLEELLARHLNVAQETLTPAQAHQYSVLRTQLLASSPSETTGQYTLAPFQILPAAGPSPQGIFSMATPGHYASIVAVLNHPFSRGAAHLQSSDPAAPPRLDPRALSHALDLELHARHVLLLERLRATPPLAALFKRDDDGGRRIHNGGRRIETLDEARGVIREAWVPHWHACGTAAMMPREKGGVVDARLRVHGVAALRCVDASVFPLIPRGNIQAAVYAVAERAAEILEEGWRAGEGA